VNDFSCVARQRSTAGVVFFFDQPEDLGEFARCLLRSGHQCVASGDSRNLGNPTVRLVPIDDELVVVESHDLIVDRLRLSEPAYSTRQSKAGSTFRS